MFLDHTQWRSTVGRTLWTSDQLVAETSTWQHTTLTTDKYPCPRWDSNPQSQQASGPAVCLWDELITRPEESYRLCYVVVCDLETSRIGAPYIYDISRLRVNDLTLILLTWRKWWAPNNTSKQHMGFNSGFKGLMVVDSQTLFQYKHVRSISIPSFTRVASMDL